MPIEPRGETLGGTGSLLLSSSREQRPGNEHALDRTQVAIAQQSRSQMKRCRERQSLQARWRAAAGQKRRFESILHLEQGSVPFDRSHEIDELGTTGEDDVLTIVDLDAVKSERRCLSPKQPAALDQLHAVSGTFELEGRTQPGQAGAHDDYMACSHDLAMTASLDRPVSDARRCNGSRGLRAISRRICW